MCGAVSDMEACIPALRRCVNWTSWQTGSAVLLLVAIEDLSYADVAQIQGITQDLVVSLLADGRERLRQPGMAAAEAGRRGG
jgi:hypothetical protein